MDQILIGKTLVNREDIEFVEYRIEGLGHGDGKREQSLKRESLLLAGVKNGKIVDAFGAAADIAVEQLERLGVPVKRK